MKPLIEEIQDILTPRGKVGMVANDKIYQLQPITTLETLIELGEELPIDGQNKILALLSGEKSVIKDGILYFANYGLNFKGRLQEIFGVYNEYIKEVVGDKQALIKLYDTIPIEDIANLIEDHVIFVMKKMATTKERTLAAIRYLPTYDIHFEKKTFRMPSCTIAIRIDQDLHLDNPEIISKGYKYEHPFVYRGKNKLGQKICMGSFYKSKEQQDFHKLRFANNVNYLIKQSVQILTTGYNRSVTPANGHLTSSKYNKYIVKVDK